MNAPGNKTILCIASYDKGRDFMLQCKEDGYRVVLITSESLKDQNSFPIEAIDELFYMRDENKVWDRAETVRAVSHLARTRVFDRVVPLDDFDLEMAATIREHLRVPGMGETTTRYFRDKLAMRVRARSAGLKIPAFVHLLNDDKVRAFCEEVPAPWVLKPRFSAGAIGIKRVKTYDELRAFEDELGDERSDHLLEAMIEGDVFHVDSIIQHGAIQFACACGYGRPPLAVAHDGDVFVTRRVKIGSDLERRLLEANERVLTALKLMRGASHTEFILGKADDELYFLETSARVGGAHTADVVAHSTGVNLWREWARVEMAGEEGTYQCAAPSRQDYAGLIISLAKEAEPDTSSFSDPEVVWRLKKHHHVGLIVQTPSHERMQELLDRYVERIKNELYAYAPPPDKPIE